VADRFFIPDYRKSMPTFSKNSKDRGPTPPRTPRPPPSGGWPCFATSPGSAPPTALAPASGGRRPSVSLRGAGGQGGAQPPEGLRVRGAGGPPTSLRSTPS